MMTKMSLQSILHCFKLSFYFFRIDITIIVIFHSLHYVDLFFISVFYPLLFISLFLLLIAVSARQSTLIDDVKILDWRVSFSTRPHSFMGSCETSRSKPEESESATSGDVHPYLPVRAELRKTQLNVREWKAF